MVLYIFSCGSEIQDGQQNRTLFKNGNSNYKLFLNNYKPAWYVQSDLNISIFNNKKLEDIKGVNRKP